MLPTATLKSQALEIAIAPEEMAAERAVDW
jgi:hypothetical protein